MHTLSLGLMATCISDKYRDQIRGCQETWVAEASHLNVVVRYFVGEHVDPILEAEVPTLVHLPGIGDDYASASSKQWHGLRWMLDHTPADYYFLGASDNYVEVQRLLDVLQKYNPQQPFIISGYGESRRFYGYQIYMPLGGCGIVFTHSALVQIAPHFEEWQKSWTEYCTRAERLDFINACDLALGHFIWQEGIPMVRERDFYPCRWDGSFVNPDTDNFNVGGMNYERVITCHYMDRQDMRRYQRYRGQCSFYMKLKSGYLATRDTGSDIHEHIMRLYEMAKQCTRIIDAGFNFSFGSWPLIKGLIDNEEDSSERLLYTSYGAMGKFRASGTGVPEETQEIMSRLGVKYVALTDENMPLVDMVFIAGWHCYPQVKLELEQYSACTGKWLVIHCTSTDAEFSESLRCGHNIPARARASGFSEEEIKKGIWPAITEFLQEHPDWCLEERLLHNNGLTILSRVK